MKWFFNLRIGAKLLIGFTLIALLAGAIGVVGITNIGILKTTDAKLYKENTEPLGKLGQIGSTVPLIRLNVLYCAVSAGDSAKVTKYSGTIEELYKKLQADLAAFKTTITSEEVAKEFETLDTTRQTYKTYLDKIVACARKGDKDGAMQIVNSPELGKLKDQLVKSIDTLFATTITNAKSISASNTALAKAATLNMSICVLFGIVLAIGLGLFISSTITRPVRKLVDAANELANGKTDIQVNIDAKDEVGDLSRALAKVVDTINTLVAETTRLTTAALDGQLDTRGDVGQFSGEYRRLVQGINDTLDAVISPLNQAQIVLGKMAVNDFTVRMEGDFHGDFARFSEAIDNVRERMTHVQEIVSRIAEGDLSDQEELRRLGRRSDNDRLVPSMLAMADALTGVINELEKLVTASNEGRLDTRADARQFAGKYREMLDGVNAMLEVILQPVNEAAQVMERMAENDLTARVTGDYKGDHAKIKNNLNNACAALEGAIVSVLGIAQQVAESANQVSLAVESVGKASQDVSSGSQQVATGSTEQTRIATQASSNMVQLQRAIEEVARGVAVGAQGAEQSTNAAQQAVEGVKRIAGAADAAREDAKGAGQVAGQGARIVQDTVAGMDRVRSASNESGENIAALGQASTKIGEIVEAINDIAEQTNLLALNAAIEAARAGEHGKGFAVVADEVRKLAERSAGQTKEIATLIRGIQEGIETAVSSMAVASKEVENGVEMANKAGASLNEILQAVEKVVAQVDVVTSVCQEVEANSADVLRAAENVSSATEQANAAAEEMAATSGEVSSAFDQVVAIIEQSSATAEELSAAAEEQNASVEELTAISKELSDLADQTREQLEQFSFSEGGQADAGMRNAIASAPLPAKPMARKANRAAKSA